jgi:hypothetical protein
MRRALNVSLSMEGVDKETYLNIISEVQRLLGVTLREGTIVGVAFNNICTVSEGVLSSEAVIELEREGDDNEK